MPPAVTRIAFGRGVVAAEYLEEALEEVLEHAEDHRIGRDRLPRDRELEIDPLQVGRVGRIADQGRKIPDLGGLIAQFLELASELDEPADLSGSGDGPVEARAGRLVEERVTGKADVAEHDRQLVLDVVAHRAEQGRDGLVRGLP